MDFDITVKIWTSCHYTQTDLIVIKTRKLKENFQLTVTHFLVKKNPRRGNGRKSKIFLVDEKMNLIYLTYIKTIIDTFFFQKFLKKKI